MTDPTTDGRLVLDFINPFEADAAARIRQRIRDLDQWIDHCIGEIPANATLLLGTKRRYLSYLSVAEAVGEAGKIQAAHDAGLIEGTGR